PVTRDLGKTRETDGDRVPFFGHLLRRQFNLQRRNRPRLFFHFDLHKITLTALGRRRKICGVLRRTPPPHRLVNPVSCVKTHRHCPSTLTKTSVDRSYVLNSCLMNFPFDRVSARRTALSPETRTRASSDATIS